MSLFHVLRVAVPGVPSPVLTALVDGGIVFGFTLFSALVTLSAAQVRADPFIALYGPLMGAGLAFFFSLKTELKQNAVLAPAERVKTASDPPTEP